MADTKTVYLCAGGTGGHVMPAAALAKELMDRGYNVHFITDDRGQRYLQEPLYPVTLLPLRRKGGLKGKADYFFSLVQSFFKTFFLVKKSNTQGVISFGGYISFPANLVAFIKRIPLMLHEQNAFMGLVNRVFECVAKHVALSMPLSNKPFMASRMRSSITGMPVREAFFKARDKTYHFDKSQKSINILVIGGSQGASLFTEVVPKALKILSGKISHTVKISLQSAQNNLDCLRESEDSLGDIEIAPFFTDMDHRLQSADFVIARAGASTVAELAAVGRPALLVPYPYAAGNHQYYNAKRVVDAEAGWMMPNKDFTAEALAGFLGRLLKTPSALTFAAGCARRLGSVNAVQQLANRFEEVLADCQAVNKFKGLPEDGSRSTLNNERKLV